MKYKHELNRNIIKKIEISKFSFRIVISPVPLRLMRRGFGSPESDSKGLWIPRFAGSKVVVNVMFLQVLMQVGGLVENSLFNPVIRNPAPADAGCKEGYKQHKFLSLIYV
jgi:hypothetical protein